MRNHRYIVLICPCLRLFRSRTASSVLVGMPVMAFSPIGIPSFAAKIHPGARYHSSQNRELNTLATSHLKMDTNES
ncbi:hypothetical protein Y032_0340g2993 [Ancylostoma ceylanicum]|uniref:Uncharacterized protein n=1 Tax=Ancylostoma ceylanicum TaxID=53326 RepID=A0A016RYZ6_9BILA|nr:hypothetical protein Y032_0340g2993 [Ancylostoma ceylanicum]